MAQPNRPDKSLRLEESNLEFKMTYLMLNDILRFTGGPDEAMASILTNQDTRDLIIRRLMTDAKKPIKSHKDLIPIEDVDIDIYEIDDALAWVMEHITYFFMRTVEKVQKAVGKFPELAEKMKTESSGPSKIGSMDSQTPTKSAGPTE